ncbi:MAG: LCP family protein [Acidimicrobiales bacterium]
MHLVVYGVSFALAVIAIPVLSIVGVQALLDSRDGEIIDPVLDPTRPGYQALVSPSPTLAVLHLDPDGSLVGVAMLALAGEDDDDAGGSALLMAPSTVASVPDLGDLTLEYIQSINGTESTWSLMEWVLGIGIDEVTEIGHDTWAEAVEPLGGLTITNPDALSAEDGELTFEAGEVTLAPEEVGPYLSVLAPGENPLNRVLRQELVWNAWLQALADEPDAARFAGEQDRGLARFAPTIAAGPHRVETLPVTTEGVVPEPGEPALLLPDDDAIAELVPELVPFPAGARPGDRPLVRVLDGSARPELLPVVVRDVAIAGGQVVLIGNTDEFGVAETTIRYDDPELEGFARSVVETLGVGNVVEVDHIDDNAELVIVLGDDYTG